eukprot:g80230.t1
MGLLCVWGWSAEESGGARGYRRELCLCEYMCESAFASFPDESVTGHKLCEKKRIDEWVMNVWWFDLNSQASTHLMFWGFDSPCHGASALGWFYGNSH